MYFYTVFGLEIMIKQLMRKMYVFESIHLDEFLYLLMEKHMANFYLSNWNKIPVNCLKYFCCYVPLVPWDNVISSRNYSRRIESEFSFNSVVSRKKNISIFRVTQIINSMAFTLSLIFEKEKKNYHFNTNIIISLKSKIWQVLYYIMSLALLSVLSPK